MAHNLAISVHSTCAGARINALLVDAGEILGASTVNDALWFASIIRIAVIIGKTLAVIAIPINCALRIAATFTFGRGGS